METLTLLIAIAVVLLSIVGVVGAIVPGLPGPPLNLGALLLTKLMWPEEVTWTVVAVFAVLTAVVTGVDYIAPSWLTQLGGGSKSAVTGSVIGTVAGLFFFAPYGLIIGPFVGALIGELLADASLGKALRVALLSFVAFLLTTGLKLILAVVLCYYTAAAWVSAIMA
jgi:hypothetical protein